jgi:hypothetical protein
MKKALILILSLLVIAIILSGCRKTANDENDATPVLQEDKETNDTQSDETHDADETPGTTDKPGTDETPGTAGEPGKGETTGTTDKPGTDETPGTADKPGTGETTGTANKPGTDETPGTADKPSSADKPGTGETTGATEQVLLMADNIDLWAAPEEYIYDVYHYTVTDLDGNGRLELIISNIGGTGIYTYSKFYEVNETCDGLNVCEHMIREGDSEADIAADTVAGYYDPQSDIMYYIFDDLLRNGAAEYYDNKRALYLEDGRINEILLAYKATIYTNPDTEPEITCQDKDRNVISEEEYEEIADRYFADLEKKKVSFDWNRFFQKDEVRDLSRDDLVEMLMKSYEAFKIE